MKVEAADLKQMRALKTAFLRLTNTDSWEDALDKYPQFASEEQLRKFIRMDLNKSIPRPFADFCTRAKLSGSGSDSTSPNNSYVSYQHAIACVVDAKTTELSGHIITRSFSAFKGAHITLISMTEVCKFTCTDYIYIHVYNHCCTLGVHKRKCGESRIHS